MAVRSRSYLHGVADNRSGAAGIIGRFVPRGFDVLAYDSRAHGTSQGDACTYGFFEREDLRNVLDTARPGPVVLIGASLGAAVALQAAAVDSRVTAVIAAETFSDLQAVVADRAPRIFTERLRARALMEAERLGRFDVEQVSPVKAASRISIPVLLVHGEKDVETPPEHSRRVFAALRGPKRLLLVQRAGHNQSLHPPEVWTEIVRWIDANLPRTAAP